MKKFMALCLTIIMVISMFTVAVSAATITVPEKTVINGVFSGSLSAMPDGWTLTEEGGETSFTATGITTGKLAGSASGVENGIFTVNANDSFAASNAGYKFNVSFKHHSGICYIHFGAPTIADAIINDTNIANHKGYVLTASTSDYKEGKYTLYKNGVSMGTIADPAPSTWLANKTPSFEINVNSTGVTVTYGATVATFKDNEPILNGYVGARMQQQTTDKNTTLVSMSLTTKAYEYNVDDSQATTGGYVVVGQEYVESHEGELYINADLRNGSAPEGVTVSGGPTYNTDGAKFTGFAPSQKVDFGTLTNIAEDVIVEAKYTAVPDSNTMTMSFFGYTLKGGEASKNLDADGNKCSLVLSDSTGVIGSYITDPGNGIKTIKVIFEDGKINVHVDSTLAISNVADTTLSRSGSVVINGGYVGNPDPTIAYVKVYTPDYADTSRYVNETKTNFLLDRTFTSNDTLDGIRADGFTVSSATGVNTENGIYAEGTGNKPTVTYTKVFGGAYTAELTFRANTNPMTFDVNISEDGKDYYRIWTNHNAETFYIDKYVDGAKVSTIASISTGATYISETMKYTVTFAPNDAGDLTITATADRITNGGSKTITGVDYMDATSAEDVDDGDPLTEGTLKVGGGYLVNETNYIYAIKVYPGTTAPAYTGNFLVNGTTTADKGDTVFTFPVMMLGQTPDVIAALYEDGKMTDIKMVDLDELNENGYAQIFNTTASTANDVNVKVFIWDSLAGMTPVTESFALNK